MKARILSLTLAAALVATLMAGAFAAQQAVQQNGPKLYKWVDKSGVVHYGSTVPPEYANQQLDILNSEGVTVQTVAAPKTPQEIAKEQQTKAAAAKAASRQQQQQMNDQMLLDTYTSVPDIEQDRDSHLTAADSQINVINGIIDSLRRAVMEYQKRATELTHAGKPVPANLKKDLDSTQQQLVADQQLLLKQQQGKQAIQERYSAYIKRFQQLTQNQSSGGN